MTPQMIDNVNNPIAAERLRYDVLYHTDLKKSVNYNEIFDQLCKLDLDSAMIIGSVEVRTTAKLKRTDMNTVLTCFSPHSKDKALLMPDVTLDEYINLKAIVEMRMKIVDMTATGDDNLLSDGEKNDLEYRKEQLKRLKEEVVDIEEMPSGISIVDLGLNEFRTDAVEYRKNHPDMDKVPFGLHSVAPAAENCHSSMASNSVAENFGQIFSEFSPETIRRVL